MVPDALVNFFIASAGAGAALLGLLFVSLSISPEEKITASSPIEKRVSAYGALSSLINAFFISLGALIPGSFTINVLIFAAISFTITLQNSITLLRPHEGASSLRRRLSISALNMLVYIIQGYYALRLLINPQDLSPVYSMTTLLLVVYVLGILRAWELLGGERNTRLQLFASNQKQRSSSPVTKEQAATDTK